MATDDERSDFAATYDLALRRCGSRPARFVLATEPGAASAYFLDERIRRAGADVRLDVVPAATSTDDASIDFAFLDLEPGRVCADDLDAWWRKLRPGGLLAGRSDGAPIPPAVEAFVVRHGLRRAFRAGAPAWLIYRPIPIDAIYCINLASRPDRRRAALAQLQAAGLAGRVTFFDAVRGRDLAHPGVISDGQAGCSASHLRVMREARARGARHVLIFEDDIVLVPGFAARFEAALARCPASYDLFYAGALCVREWGNYLHPFDDVVSRAGHVYGCHAYVVNLERLPRFEAALGESRRVIDQFYASDLQPESNCYVCTPYLAFQAPGISDIGGGPSASSRGYSRYVWR